MKKCGIKGNTAGSMDKVSSYSLLQRILTSSVDVMKHLIFVSIVIISISIVRAENFISPELDPNARSIIDKLDTRTAVPLLPMMAHHQKALMRDHLMAVQEIISALSIQDFSAIEKAVSRIGYSDASVRMCEHMGAAAPKGFSEMGVKFHKTANNIGEAARAKDTMKVQLALKDTLAVCTSCHAAYKQQVVDEAAWQFLTGASPKTRLMH